MLEVNNTLVLLNLYKVSDFAVSTMRPGFINTTYNEPECVLLVGVSQWISYHSNATFAFVGKVFQQRYWERELENMDPHKDLDDFKFVSGNVFPKQKVQFCCHDIPKKWTCAEKALKCKSMIMAIAKNTIIETYEIEDDIDISVFTSLHDVRKICLSSKDFLMEIQERKLHCTGADEMFALGKQYCQKFVQCLGRSFRVLAEYMKDVSKCKERYRYTNNTSLQYGIIRDFRKKIEYLKKTMSHSMSVIPRHFISKCSWKQAFLEIRRPFETDLFKEENNILLCRRTTPMMVKSYRIFPTCWSFIEECLKVFDCIEKQSICSSEVFGEESLHGFKLDHYITSIQLYQIANCDHWGVELAKQRDGHLYCSAKRFFKIDNFLTFCRSYDWVCRQVIHCFRTRSLCEHYPNKANFTTQESTDVGLYNIFMPHYSPRDNPRRQVPALFRCNKKHGYDQKVFVYFISAMCVEGQEFCNLDMSQYQDKLSFQIGVRKTQWHLTNSRPGHITLGYHNNPQDLLYIWACKRDSSSTIGCPEFLETCEKIIECLTTDKAIEISHDLPPDNACFSPLPVSTLNPMPKNGGRRGHAPGVLGPSITFTMPLERSFPRIFQRLYYSGWDTIFHAEIQDKRTNIFFNIFLEDCRWKHGFEGFLIEPYLTETIDYLICSIPFGMRKFKENSLVTKGCPHMRRVCEEMRNCYVHHAKYFKFHSFFNEHNFTLALIMMLIFLLSLALMIANRYLYPIPMPWIERLVEYFVYIALGFTSISLLAFSLAVEGLAAGLGAKNANAFLIMRVSWNFGSFLLTACFHVYIVCFTFR